MATIDIYGVSYTSAYWQINGLGFVWDTDQYNYAYATFNGAATAGVYPPPPVGTSSSTPVTFYSSLTQGTTYSVVGYIQTPSGLYTTSNTFTFTTPRPRPPSFFWSLPKNAGSQMQVSAYEWGQLQANIQLVQQYRGVPLTTFTSVGAGTRVNQSYLFNEVINAIGTMNSSVYPNVGTSTRFNDSSLFARIQNSLNAIS